MGRDPMNFHADLTTTYVCRNGQSYADCVSLGTTLVEDSTWTTLAYLDDASVPATRVLKRTETTFDHGDGNLRTLRKEDLHQIRADADEYLVRVQKTTNELIENGTAETVGQTLNYWIDHLRKLRTSDVYIDGKTSKKTTYEIDHRGLITKEFSPKAQAEGGSWDKFIEYDAVGVTTTKTTTVPRIGAPADQYHVVHSYQDIGLGVTLLTQGPNFVCPGQSSCQATDATAVFESARTVYDGFGRPTEFYVARDDDTNGYAETLMTATSYADTPADAHGYDDVISVTTSSLVGQDTYAQQQTFLDGLGREVKIIQSQSETADAETDYAWDKAGQVASINVPAPHQNDGQVTYAFDFDSLGRPLTVTAPNGEVISATAYDGLVTTTTEPGTVNAPAATKHLTHNAHGQLEKVEEDLGAGQVAATVYAYDGNGNVARMIDPGGDETILTHDWANRRVRIERAGEVWRYGYDRNDNLVSIVLPNALPDGADEGDYTTVMAYDLLNRQTRYVPAVADLTAAEQTTFAIGETVNVYDLPQSRPEAKNTIGRLTASTSPILSSVMDYDAGGRTVYAKETITLAGLGQLSNADVATVSDYYDSGALRAVTINDGGTTTYVDGFHLFYDSVGRPQSIDGGGNQLARLMRNHAGLVTRRVSQPGSGDVINSFWLYDDLGRVTSTTVNHVNPARVQTRLYSQTYSYHPNSMPNLITERFGVDPLAAFSYLWDTRHQVKRVIQTAGEPGYGAAFDYNAAGRMVSANVALSTSDAQVLARTRVFQRDVDYVFDAVDPQRVDLLRDAGGNDYADYDYDQRGNVVRRTLFHEPGNPSDDQTWDFRYDGDSRLRQVSGPGGTETYYYNGPTRVLAVRSDGKVRRWYGDLEVHYLNGVHDKFRYHAKLGQTVARIDNGTTVEYTFQTSQNHEALSVAADGEIKMGKVYGPFAEILDARLGSDRDAQDYPKEFNGKDYDRSSLWHYYGYRYYDPIAVMWNRADPRYRFVPDQGDDEPRKANLYAYTLNNPLNLVDPDGLETETIEELSAGVARQVIDKLKRPKTIYRTKSSIGKRIRRHIKSQEVRIRGSINYDATEIPDAFASGQKNLKIEGKEARELKLALRRTFTSEAIAMGARSARDDLKMQIKKLKAQKARVRAGDCKRSCASKLKRINAKLRYRERELKKLNKIEEKMSRDSRDAEDDADKIIRKAASQKSAKIE